VFENAWRSQKPMAIESVLSDRSCPNYLQTLEELVLIEIEFQWERFHRLLDYGVRGEDASALDSLQWPRTVSDYLRQFPELKLTGIRVRLRDQEHQCRDPEYHRPCRSAAGGGGVDTIITGFDHPQLSHSFLRDDLTWPPSTASWQSHKVESPQICRETGVPDSPGVKPSLLSILRQSPLFREVPDGTLRQLCGISQEVCFNEGEVIIWEGHLAPGLFLIREGVARIECEGNDPKEVILLNEVAGGEVLGEMSLMAGQPCSATVRAITQLRAFHLPVHACRRLADQTPGSPSRIKIEDGSEGGERSRLSEGLGGIGRSRGQSVRIGRPAPANLFRPVQMPAPGHGVGRTRSGGEALPATATVRSPSPSNGWRGISA
jgi:hypothetical protein